MTLTELQARLATTNKSKGFSEPEDDPRALRGFRALNVLAETDADAAAFLLHYRLLQERAKVGWIATKLMLSVGELAEGFEELRNGRRPNEVYYKDGKPEGFPVEVADAIIRELNLLTDEGVDADFRIQEKDLYNQKRPFKHGGKAF